MLFSLDSEQIFEVSICWELSTLVVVSRISQERRGVIRWPRIRSNSDPPLQQFLRCDYSEIYWGASSLHVDPLRYSLPYTLIRTGYRRLDRRRDDSDKVARGAPWDSDEGVR